MKPLKMILALLACISFWSCSKVIKVDLDTAPSKLVIDASIDWVKNTPGNKQTIRLSTSTGYYDAAFPGVSGATVFITNTANTVFNFPESTTAGEYTCTDFAPVTGETYTLTVQLNGTTYTAVETLTGTPEIESTIHQSKAGGMTGDEMEIQFAYQDDGAQENYYMAGIQTNRVAYPEYLLESDRNFQGKQMMLYYSHKDLKAGDPVHIKLYGVSRRFFEYFKKILVSSGVDSGPFPTTPSAVRGNIMNQTDAENYALGYFRLSEVAVRDYTIQ